MAPDSRSCSLQYRTGASSAAFLNRQTRIRGERQNEREEPMKIGGRTAIITGASSGIGRAIATKLAGHGAKVALVARRAEGLNAVVDEIGSGNGVAIAIRCDVSDSLGVRSAKAEIHRQLGPIDILVNAAGFGIWRHFGDISEDEHRAMMDVNYWGSFNWIRAVLPEMISRDRGRIVNISSASGKFALPVSSGYSASKFAITGLSESLHREFLGTGVGVSCIHPGSVKTDFWDESRIPTATIPPLVRYAPKMSAAAIARWACLAIWAGIPSLTIPFFANFLAKMNSVWLRLGDLMLWRWFIPVLLGLVAIRVAYPWLGG